MGSALERAALRRVLDQLHAAGITLPAVHALCLDAGSTGARLWAAAHPDDDRAPCCYGSLDDPSSCTCWAPVYDVAQAPPRPPTGPDDLRARQRMCGDCAYRPGSPERRDAWMAETLLELPTGREPFWCHDGMRRPDRWEHPDGRSIAGSPDDWHPARLGQLPYRADGSPALLCAGWAALAARAAAEGDHADG